MDVSELRLRQPIVILVEPQLGENIGAAIRAMANFGLFRMRLVAPRDGWPNSAAVASASGATHVLDHVTVHETLDDALKDVNTVFATTRRERDMIKPVCGPDNAADRIINDLSLGQTAMLFGRERWGLNNEEVALSDEILTLPVDPEFGSLNISQAVIIIAYEWRRALLKAQEEASIPFQSKEYPPATKHDLIGLMEHLESALDRENYFRPPEKRIQKIQNLRSILQNASLTEGEVRTLRGVVATLEGRKGRPRKGNNSVDLNAENAEQS